jgi:cellulose synthase/poly-beta-1,6-N-acetylglucosamine synthase-like glycosyltransferase
VLNQAYPDYEVIVVNDCSEDSTFEVLGELLPQYPRLKVSTVTKDPKFSHSKKFAQFIGIKAAKNDILLFTDADCKPESDKWLEGMVSHFNDKTSFVIGYGGYIRTRGLLNRYIRYDTMTVALQYLGMAIRGLPYMGVGRNLAYRRSVFFDKKGFGSYKDVVSGDDDLFVNAYATRANTSVEFRKENHTRSVPSSRTGQWLTQKRRHMTSAPYYKFRDKVFVASEPLSRILFYASFAILLSMQFMWPVVVAIFAVRFIVQIIVLEMGRKTLNEKGLSGFWIFFDIFSPVINGIVYLSSKLGKSGKNKWK